MPARLKNKSNCLQWLGRKRKDGYGYICFNGATVLAHRFLYEEFKGKIPKGLEIDHLCRNRGCVNPEHLEAVTRRVNQLRGNGASGINARKSYCINGHEFSKANTFLWMGSKNPAGQRKCRRCAADNARRFKARRKTKEK